MEVRLRVGYSLLDVRPFRPQRFKTRNLLVQKWNIEEDRNGLEVPVSLVVFCLLRKERERPEPGRRRGGPEIF